MVKLLYKPMAIALGILAGSLAGKVVTKVWTKVDDNDVPPEPDLKEASWALVLAGAALQGIVFSVVKAAVKRGGAQGVEKVTGTWPGKTVDDLEPAAA